MQNTIPSAGRYENLRFLLGHFLPYYLSGIFLRCRITGWLFTRLGIHPFRPRFFDSLRERHASDRIYIRLLGRRVLLLFDADDIRQVLENSPAVYAEPGNKHRGMGFFQPDAVTLSRGSAWQKRRAFNEQVLETPKPVHALAGDFLTRIDGLMPATAPRDWQEFSRLFSDIALEVIFGRIDEHNKAALGTLLRLMGKANRLFWLKPSPDQAAMEALIRSRFHEALAGSLLSLAPGAPADPDLQPARQVPHWLFAIGDTLPMNLIRALLLIVGHPDVLREVRAEITATDLTSPQGVAELHLLEGCIQEAMRLWPTTPLLGREMICRDALGDAQVPAGTQVMILNGYLHRDTRIAEGANRFRPQRWAEGVPPFTYNHLSNGTQGCAGRHLALFLGKAVLARLLARWSFRDPSPAVDATGDIPLINNHFEIRFNTEAADR